MALPRALLAMGTRRVIMARARWSYLAAALAMFRSEGIILRDHTIVSREPAS